VDTEKGKDHSKPEVVDVHDGKLGSEKAKVEKKPEQAVTVKTANEFAVDKAAPAAPRQ
jgi:hypothetical protein